MVSMVFALKNSSLKTFSQLQSSKLALHCFLLRRADKRSMWRAVQGVPLFCYAFDKFGV